MPAAACAASCSWFEWHAHLDSVGQHGLAVLQRLHGQVGAAAAVLLGEQPRVDLPELGHQRPRRAGHLLVLVLPVLRQILYEGDKSGRHTGRMGTNQESCCYHTRAATVTQDSVQDTFD